MKQSLGIKNILNLRTGKLQKTKSGKDFAKKNAKSAESDIAFNTIMSVITALVIMMNINTLGWFVGFVINIFVIGFYFLSYFLEKLSG